MKAVRIIQGTGLPLKRSDVDTDQIIPAEWLKRVERTGFEKGLFATWRDDRDFVLNDERYAGASILVAGPSFGVGSSREHAVWAIQQGGFDAVIAPSFSDIFRNNCTKNGLVPVVLPEATVERLWDLIEADPSTEITIDMERLVVEVPIPGVCRARLEGAEGLLERLAADRFARVAVVVHREDRHPPRIGQDFPEGPPCFEKLAGEGRGGQVARDEDMVGIERADPVDHLFESLEAKPPGSPCE